jgi:hypothetical protein
LTIEEFDREKKWWTKRKTNEFAWKVSAKELAERNYNLDCKNPHTIAADHDIDHALPAKRCGDHGAPQLDNELALQRRWRFRNEPPQQSNFAARPDRQAILALRR